MEDDILYNVRITTAYPYDNPDNYKCYHTEDDYELSHSSIEDLYEAIARERNTWQIRVEQQVKCNKGYSADEYEFNVSPIFTVVEQFSMDKLKATEEYKKLGEKRDAFLAKEKILKEEQKKREEEWLKRQQEEQDRKDFERLSKKFNK